MTTEARFAPDYDAQPQHENKLINKRLRLAGTLVSIGVVIEGLTLLWNHPLSFLAFVGVGGMAMAIGVVVYLLALVSPGQKSRS